MNKLRPQRTAIAVGLMLAFSQAQALITPVCGTVDGNNYSGVDTLFLNGSNGASCWVALTGGSNYSGGTKITGGSTLQIGNGGTSGSITGNIDNNGTLAFNRADNTSFAGGVSGFGNLSKLGSNTLTLTGGIYLSGIATVSGGTLEVVGDFRPDVVVADSARLVFNKLVDDNYSGSISGAGSFIKQDDKELHFYGNILNTGGTTIAGGTLVFQGGVISGDVTNMGKLVLSQSNDFLFGGSISGSGSVEKQSSNTLILSGANSYSGGTKISSGTLLIGAGGSFNGNVLLGYFGTLAFGREDDISFAGAISGDGRLEQRGGGMLTLTGDNSFSGGTTVTRGTLRIGDGGTSGALGGGVVNNGRLIFDRADDASFAGQISGYGELIKQGAGKLTLTGEHSYSGGTRVEAGTLQIGDGSSISSVTGNIWNAGTLVFNQAAYAEFGGNISGGGGLMKLGAGILSLTGSHTVGTTTVDEGELRIWNGGSMDSGFVYLGGANGAALVFGSGSQWRSWGDMVVGSYGSASLGIIDGGAVSNGWGLVGQDKDSVAHVTVAGAGSSWTNNGKLHVGVGGKGQLLIAAGGLVSSKGAALGLEQGSSGSVTVVGAGSRWDNSGELLLGVSGAGELSIQEGGLVTSQSATLGVKSGSTGNARLIAGNWSNSGDMIVGQAGQGYVELQGGQLSNAGDLIVGQSGQGQVLLSNGALTSSRGGIVGAEQGSTGRVDVYTSQWNNSGDLVVGGAGTGTLVIQTGGLVNGQRGTIGNGSSGSGSVLVNGAGSQWNNKADLFVGLWGAGTLSVKDGGWVGAQNGYLGLGAGITGAAAVSGAGSQWKSTGELHIGHYGTGTLLIENGGAVSNQAGYIGRWSGSQGAATVSGAGSQWNNAGELYIGHQGAGSLTIKGGGVVNNQTGHIGEGSGSSGAVSVSGWGSKWNNAGNLYVGQDGAGTLSIQNSAQVTADALFIGGQGTVNLEGGQLQASQGFIKVDGKLNWTGGTLSGSFVQVAPGGSLVSSGDNSLQAFLFNEGSVESKSGTLNFQGDVLGAGSFAGNVAFQAAYTPGYGAATVTFNGGNVHFGGGSMLTLELNGMQAGSDYGQLLNIGHLQFDGMLNLVFNFAPEAGSFSLLGFNSFGGSLAADRITVSGFDRNRLDFSQLGSSGSLTVTAVPEPSSWALMLGGAAALVGWTRRRRVVAVAA
ncbi:autotransporter-associated beta strand repeat-containing protein [Roseateles albus]|uniref:Autotransporter-associated beta strand repeat-containing protein n=1 Tax=Roseateles albus TaxID=2987525 RepID=A0ABT5KGK2_9BURK|nr:autotransporter-associated beta strand repeat-containing protein [Roseateles albus]MDC8772517.1 autotransporter-associated beta strand repeat-containing protein [Roseateles albus]